MIQFGKNGWRQNEPGYLGDPEQPVMVRQAVDLLGEAGSSLDRLLDEAHLPGDRVQALLPDPKPKRPRVNLDQMR